MPPPKTIVGAAIIGLIIPEAAVRSDEFAGCKSKSGRLAVYHVGGEREINFISGRSGPSERSRDSNPFIPICLCWSYGVLDDSHRWRLLKTFHSVRGLLPPAHV